MEQGIRRLLQQTCSIQVYLEIFMDFGRWSLGVIGDARLMIQHFELLVALHTLRTLLLIRGSRIRFSWCR